MNLRKSFHKNPLLLIPLFIVLVFFYFVIRTWNSIEKEYLSYTEKFIDVLGIVFYTIAWSVVVFIRPIWQKFQ